MVFSAFELIDMILMTLAVGYIFSGMVPAVNKTYDPIQVAKRRGFDKDQYLAAMYVAAPAVILHEFGHKFVALAFGLSAEFQAAYGWLLLGIALKFFSSPFIFLVPAYVSISGTAPAYAFALTALAGPAVNFLLWLGAKVVISQKLIGRKWYPLAILTGKVNLFLALFNMIPIHPFDGGKVFSYLLQMF